MSSVSLRERVKELDIITIGLNGYEFIILNLDKAKKVCQGRFKCALTFAMGSISFESRITLTAERSNCVVACGVSMAWLIHLAFIDV